MKFSSIIARRLRPVGTASVAAILVGCSDVLAPVQPVPGELAIRLTTPNADDGAILLRVAGPGPSAVEGAGQDYTVHARRTDDSFRAAVFGPIGNGALVRFHVPDVNKADGYVATIVEVSDRSNAVRASLAGYVVTVVRE